MSYVSESNAASLTSSLKRGLLLGAVTTWIRVNNIDRPLAPGARVCVPTASAHRYRVSTFGVKSCNVRPLGAVDNWKDE